MASFTDSKLPHVSPPAAVQLIVDSLHARGWVLEITYPEQAGDGTVITAKGLPKRYITISEDGVASLNQDEQGLGGDTTIASLTLSHISSEREAQVREISLWFG